MNYCNSYKVLYRISIIVFYYVCLDFLSVSSSPRSVSFSTHTNYKSASIVLKYTSSRFGLRVRGGQQQYPSSQINDDAILQEERNETTNANEDCIEEEDEVIDLDSNSSTSDGILDVDQLLSSETDTPDEIVQSFQKDIQKIRKEMESDVISEFESLREDMESYYIEQQRQQQQLLLEKIQLQRQLQKEEVSSGSVSSYEDYFSVGGEKYDEYDDILLSAQGQKKDVVVVVNEELLDLDKNNVTGAVMREERNINTTNVDTKAVDEEDAVLVEEEVGHNTNIIIENEDIIRNEETKDKVKEIETPTDSKIPTESKIDTAIPTDRISQNDSNEIVTNATETTSSMDTKNNSYSSFQNKKRHTVHKKSNRNKKVSSKKKKVSSTTKKKMDIVKNMNAIAPLTKKKRRTNKTKSKPEIKISPQQKLANLIDPPLQEKNLISKTRQIGKLVLSICMYAIVSFLFEKMLNRFVKSL